MNERKFLSIGLLSFSFVVLTSSLALAEHDCTHEIVHSDGTKTITTDCSSSYTQTEGPGAENFRDQYFFSTMANNLLDGVQWGLQNFQDRTGEQSSAQVKADQIAADSREKEQEAIDAVRIKQQEQEIQLENSKH